MGQGKYFLLAYGILQPVRMRGPISTDEFWKRIETVKARAGEEGIVLRSQYEARTPWLAIPTADTEGVWGRPLAVQDLSGPIVNDSYAIGLIDFPKLALNALGPEREKVENWWLRVIYLASRADINMALGQWLFINEFD